MITLNSIIHILKFIIFQYKIVFDIKRAINLLFRWRDIAKLDGVGPADNRPSTDKLHHFVPSPPQKKCDM